MNLGIQGKNALITGATDGLGRATAEILAEEGVNLVLHGTGRNGKAEKLEALCVELETRFGVRTVLACADLAEPGAARKLFAEASASMPIDLLVNNAAIWPCAYVREMTEADFSHTIAVNLEAPFVLCREMVNQLCVGGRRGKIVNIVSQAAFHGSTSGHAHYAASKAGLVGFSISLAREVAPLGIHVNCVAPGMMRTPMNRQALAQRENEYLKRIPLGRIAEPCEVASSVAFLLSNKADYITGATLDLTGGMLMR